MVDVNIGTGALLFVVGVINLLPVVGVVSARKLEVLYGVPLEDPNLIILLRHRAVLFGMLGGFMMVSAFVPHLRPMALGAGAISMIAFPIIVGLSRGHGPMNPELRRVLQADGVGVALLLVAAVMMAWDAASRTT